MTYQDIAHMRLYNQRLVGAHSGEPEDVVRWLCAVQAQDFGGAKWGVSQRCGVVASDALDELFNSGVILRTHVMRPTWHFVLPADIRWMLALTGPRVHAANAYYYRRLELNNDIFGRSEELITTALSGGVQLTRSELAGVLDRGGISARGPRLAYILMHAELEAIICSGALRRKQFTYALLDERAAAWARLENEHALAEMTRRFFESHGPATVNDYVHWSGLAVSDARRGLDMAKSILTSRGVEGQTYWFSEPGSLSPIEDPTIHLLPNYDEHIGYKHHGASFDRSIIGEVPRDHDAFMAHILTLNGMVIGGWRRTVGTKEVSITTNLLTSLNSSQRTALEAAGAKYGQFLRLPVRIS